MVINHKTNRDDPPTKDHTYDYDLPRLEDARWESRWGVDRGVLLLGLDFFSVGKKNKTPGGKGGKGQKGGNSNVFLNFHPENWGRWTHFG